MSSKFSHMDLLNQYFLKMRDSILELELENTNLKKSQNGEIDKLRKEFISLFERHKELKEAFLESEKQVKELTHERDEILQKEKELSELMKCQFEEKFDAQQFLTPKKPTSNMENESQKMKYLKAKKAPIKLELKNMYESESDSDNSKLDFNLDENNTEEESMNVMKKIIGNDLWNCMESSVNNGQHQHKSSQTLFEPQGKACKNVNFQPSIEKTGLFEQNQAFMGKTGLFEQNQAFMGKTGLFEQNQAFKGNTGLFEQNQDFMEKMRLLKQNQASFEEYQAFLRSQGGNKK